MKKLCYSAFVAFWASIATLLAVFALAEKTGEQAAAPSTVYSLKDIAAHDQPTDCWVAIEGGVYDLTEYLPSHPAPPVVLAPYCGMEATTGMRTKGYGRDHSDAAWKMLEQYRMGEFAP